MKINVIIPAYNETERLSRTLEAYKQYFFESEKRHNLKFSADELKLFIVNDGSTDETKELAEKLLSRLGIDGKVLSYDENHGKGHAVKYGMLNSDEADFYYLADADLSAGWEVLDQLVQVALNVDQEKLGAVVGSRRAKGAEVETSGFKELAGKLSNLMIRTFLGLSIEDTQCGYKLFAAKSLKAFGQQQLERWGFDFEILYLIRKMGLETKEVGIKWENREGSKVKLSDYFKTLTQLIKVRTTDYKL